MKVHQPVFPFMRVLRRVPRQQRRRGLNKAAETLRQQSRNKWIARILVIVEAVAAARAVDWKAMMSKERESPAVASARVLAIGLCCAREVPQYLVARAFRRTWATIFSAEIRCSDRYRKDSKFRKEWDKLEEKLGGKRK